MESVQQVETATAATSTSTAKLFDRSGEFEISLKRAGKTVTLGFPSDQDLIHRNGKIKTFYERGSSIPDIQGQEEADLDLVKAIRKGGDELTEDESVRVVAILLRTDVEEPTRTSDGFQVPLSVFAGIKTLHVLREPSMKELRLYRKRAFSMSEERFRKQQVTTNLSIVGDFYDKLMVRTEGYAGAPPSSIPLVHKAVVLTAMTELIRQEQEEDDPANFS